MDLGLSSGTKWATCNVGATTSSDYGNYYAWGETSEKLEYNMSNSITYEKSNSDLISIGIVNDKYILTTTHDAAQANWGSTWRIPTQKNLEELKEICTWTWTNEAGHNGYKVTGPNGNYIFLPAAGNIDRSSNNTIEEYGYYWSSSLYYPYNYAIGMFFGKERGVEVGWFGVTHGFSVRPVSD